MVEAGPVFVLPTSPTDQGRRRTSGLLESHKAETVKDAHFGMERVGSQRSGPFVPTHSTVRPVHSTSRVTGRATLVY